MKKSKFLKFSLNLILSIFIYSQVLYSQSDKFERIDQILNQRGEVYFSFNVDYNKINSFVRIISIDSYDFENKKAYAYANKKEFENFLQTGYDFEIVESYYDDSKVLNVATNISQMSDWNRYPSYPVYVEMMNKFVADYPELCKLDTIGYTTNGRILLVLKISDNANIDEAEPEFFYSSTMHGDELFGGVLYLRFADFLLSNYGIDDEVTNLVNNLEIFICPFANPDGTWYGGDNNVSSSRRYTAADIDMNRNFPDPIYGPYPNGEDYAVETQAFMNYANLRNFVMGANTHGGAELVNYPFDTYEVLPADNDWWYYVSRIYAQNAQQNSPAGYLTDFPDGVTNGFAWYQAIGTRQDYMNYFHNCRELTLELHSTKKLDSDLLPNYYNYNHRATIEYMKQALYGLQGIVTDSITGIPLQAQVFIEGHDFFNSHVYSFLPYGDYYRYLYAGNYNVKFSANGYKSKTINVNIQNDQKTTLNVQLAPLSEVPPTANFEYIFENEGCSGMIQFFNTSEASIDTQFSWNFDDGSPETNELEPIHYFWQNGSYIVRLTAQNSHGIDIIEKVIEINLPEFETQQNYFICEEEGSLMINTNSNAPEVLWFESLQQNNSFHVGDAYQTPILTENQTYFVQEHFPGQIFYGGLTTNDDGGAYVTNSSDSYLIFDCYQNCILESVKVYAQGDGARSLYLKDSQGQIILEESIFIPDGEQTITLNWIIPQGNDLRIGCKPISNLFRGFSGYLGNFNYPYNISNLISIKENNTVYWLDNKKFYSYFYDWKVRERECYSERIPINIYVNHLPEASFSYNVDGGNVYFYNLSTAADEYIWNFGDESALSNEINPEHQFVEDGTYTVTLTANSPCGSSTYSADITITSSGISENKNILLVYPNPFFNELFIENFTNDINKISIKDLSGKEIGIFNNIQSHKIKLDFSEFKNGVYFLEILENKCIHLIKVIKIK
ncbi:MAG TPA: M14 family zinc carboxypeptidase [Bacteroidales bacterium]|jgi:PKD repeat protein|nr:M14 family zinc carboxypeptidase [Bacteroidales bacterium]HOL98357.1 M14 family zinc carboxypeptidase [Bacteroidales bacterium]HOM36798.1 M14 family zinc carboxypeptidase [Bacteroidales bacterium]HPD24644.1 M14 family zinc carboxypeptidase [Bacteroidales bacterium]HRS99526.1 M14 family zinc carboxypeptidase [Bacteroidales bacterium]